MADDDDDRRRGPLWKVAQVLPGYSAGLDQVGLPGTYTGAGKPIFARPDGETPIAEDDHVAHVDAAADPMASLRDFLLHSDIGPAKPARWHPYDPEREHARNDDDA